MNERDMEEARHTPTGAAKAEAEAQGQRLEKSKRGTLFFIDH